MSKTFKSEGVVLRSLKYSETSLILDIYTQLHGMGSYIVSGVRKAKSKSSNVYHPMTIINLVAYHPGESLSRIKEGSYAYRYKNLDSDIFRSAIGTFFVDLVKSSIKEKEANESLFHFIKQTLVQLDTNPLHGLLPILFALDLAPYLGFQLGENHSSENPYFDMMSGEYIDNDIRHSYILNDHLSQILYDVSTQRTAVKLDKIDRRLLLDALMQYYKLHIEEFKELRSLPVLRTILS